MLSPANSWQIIGSLGLYRRTNQCVQPLPLDALHRMQCDDSVPYSIYKHTLRTGSIPGPTQYKAFVAGICQQPSSCIAFQDRDHTS